MAKVKSVYVCSECGNEVVKWQGKCNICGNFNTFVEQLDQSSVPAMGKRPLGGVISSNSDRKSVV